MRIYMFTSQARTDLHAFAGDEAGSKLPPRFAPWGLTGALKSNQALPHKISRPVIERAIANEGYQLWRMRPAGKAQSRQA